MIETSLFIYCTLVTSRPKQVQGLNKFCAQCQEKGQTFVSPSCVSVAEFEGPIKSSLNYVYLNLPACYQYVENKHKVISCNEIIKRVYSYIGIYRSNLRFTYLLLK